MKKYLFSCLFILLVNSCAAPPHETVIHEPGPYPENYLEQILCYLEIALEHPGSIRDFEVVKPPEIVAIDTYYGYIPLYAGQEVWETFVAYEAKDPTGQYRGRDLHVVWIRHNRLVAFDYKELELEYRLRKKRGESCAADS